MASVIRWAVLAAFAFAQGLPFAAWAQDFPVKPIRIIVGPGPDIVGRIIGQKFTEAWDQQTIVETRPGGGGAVATEAVAKAAPDGYTLLLASAAYTINAVLRPSSFNLIRDFSPVALCASAPLVLLVHPSVPVRTVQEFIALAKAKPGQINYASSGTGTPNHLAGELLKTMSGINLIHVPYKNASNAMIDAIGGQVEMYFAITSIALGQVQTGKLKSLGVTSLKRSPFAPEMPTLSESGLPGYEVIAWNGLLAPIATPRNVVAKLNTEVQKALNQSEVQQRLKGSGYEPAAANSAEQYSNYIKREIAKWAKLVKETGMTVD